MKIKRVLKWGLLLIVIVLVIWFQFAYWTSSNDCNRLSAVQGDSMKAIVYCDYGLSNIRYVDIQKPAPTDDQLLVRVHAVSINPYDWHFIEGTPYIMRALGVGLRKPKDTRLGVDYAGTVEAGKRADLCLWDVEQPAELAYAIGSSPLARRFHDGLEQGA